MYQGIREDKDEEALKKLIESGQLSVTGTNKEGMDPLILAVDCEFSTDTLEYLLKKGCDVNGQDEHGRSALHYAVDLDNIDIVKFLMEKGADPQLMDNNDSSPYDEAEDNIKVLLD